MSGLAFTGIADSAKLTQSNSYKDYKKSKEQPKFKFNCDIVKDILNPRSPMYKKPHIEKDHDKHQATWKMHMKALHHPQSV